MNLAIRQRLSKLKEHAVRRILAIPDVVPPRFHPTICAFPLSYSIGRKVLATTSVLRLDSSSKILIVGAAGGRDYFWLKASGYSVDVLDLGLHSWADQSFVGNASDPLVWEPLVGKYDMIVLCDVLEHLPEDYRALCNIRMGLKSSGMLFLTVPFKHDPEPTHVRSYSMSTLERLLNYAGLEIVSKRLRPGPFEVFPRLTNLINYGIAFALPSTETGAGVLKYLLELEYTLNELFANSVAKSTRSVQYGVVLTAVVGSRTDYLRKNLESFVKE